jgi:hypothetical protein
MIGNEQEIILISFLVIFLFLIIAIRFWPIKKVVSNNSKSKYRKLNLLTSQVWDLSEEGLKADIALLMTQGYEMVDINELFTSIDGSVKVSNKYFVMLGKEDHGVEMETLTHKLVSQKTHVIFYRSLF